MAFVNALSVILGNQINNLPDPNNLIHVCTSYNAYNNITRHISRRPNFGMQVILTWYTCAVITNLARRRNYFHMFMITIKYLCIITFA
jgi:hypothetical protein